MFHNKTKNLIFQGMINVILFGINVNVIYWPVHETDLWINIRQYMSVRSFISDLRCLNKHTLCSSFTTLFVCVYTPKYVPTFSIYAIILHIFPPTFGIYWSILFCLCDCTVIGISSTAQYNLLPVFY